MANALPLQFNPFPLGLTKVTNVGTAVQITNQYTDLLALHNYSVHQLIITSLVGNGGPVYVLIQTTNAASDQTTYLNVLAVLAQGQSFNSQYYAMDNVDITKIWIDADNANDSVFSWIMRT